ncbi:hypothetical protein [Arsenicicoccus dermatophilus]|uniref:hypothetical protein n=1 Tax=Arsenicicoccus dermatophilus TaxID=1076331 RepID=UPI001F4CC190|nr:hypothetical protein [Arsenicicoccus dermatophilus]MCH8614484.1 hypothetical protein [Arsenicicoccus dermatophilus]
MPREHDGTSPVAGGRSRAVLVTTTAAAAIPTVLSAQGMVSVGTSALHLGTATAVGLAGFLELALVASALAARDATTRGRSARVDLAATWVLSAVSGALSALHEVVTPAGVVLTPMAGLAALVRVVAPLVACWLWHRVVAGDADAHAVRTWGERQSDAARLRVAVAARAVALEDTPAARRRLDRAHRAMLRRHQDVTAEQVTATVAALALVDELPALARRVAPARPAAPTDLRPVEQPERPEQVEQVETDARPAPVVTAQVTDDVPTVLVVGPEPVAYAGGDDDHGDHLAGHLTDPDTDTDADPLAVALAVVDEHGDAATGPMVRDALAADGLAVSESTARRWLRRARDCRARPTLLEVI